VGERKKVAAGAEAPAPVASVAPASAAPAAAAAAPADDSKPLPLAELVSRGEKIYAANCVACHQATGQGMPAMKAPALAGNKLVTGAEQEPIDTVLDGRPNTAMQPFKQQLSDAEIAAVITYVRNSWGNKASEVQPAEVKARRK
jgi:cytochrome c oxidase subunit 2